MYTFRPFRNSDPPRLAEIWREQPPQRGRMQPATAGILEQLVFSKPYFDPAGLIVALHDNVPVGFAHAGFGANDEQNAIATDIGTTYQLMVRTDHRDDALAGELLAHSEAYLRERGAKVIYAGGIRPLNAFYLGLYGGSELTGVLVGDTVFQIACRQAGYREIDRVIVLELDLACFRAPITRNQRQLRREMVCQEIPSPPPDRGGTLARPAPSSEFDSCSRDRVAASRWRMFGSGISSHSPPPGAADRRHVRFERCLGPAA